MRPKPTRMEKALVGRCLMESGQLIGDDIDQIWTHPSAYRALETWRLCVDAIVTLIGGRHGVEASFIKACVMYEDGLSGVPFALDDIAEFLVKDHVARLYWQGFVDDDRYPHRCPHCSAAAFVGFNLVDCKMRCQASVPR